MFLNNNKRKSSLVNNEDKDYIEPVEELGLFSNCPKVTDFCLEGGQLRWKDLDAMTSLFTTLTTLDFSESAVSSDNCGQILYNCPALIHFSGVRLDASAEEKVKASGPVAVVVIESTPQPGALKPDASMLTPARSLPRPIELQGSAIPCPHSPPLPPRRRWVTTRLKTLSVKKLKWSCDRSQNQSIMKQFEALKELREFSILLIEKPEDGESSGDDDSNPGLLLKVGIFSQPLLKRDSELKSISTAWPELKWYHVPPY